MPLPETLELPTPQQKEWELIPEDIYQCEITDIEYKVEKNAFKKKDTDPDEVQKMNFEFTIIEEGHWYGRKLWKKMAVTKPLPPRGNNNKSWIFRIASALTGHPLTYEEGEKYTTSDINGFIHRQIRINVVHEISQSDGKTYANIDGFLAAKQQLPAFDESKVNINAGSDQPVSQQPETGYEKAQAVAATLPGANQPATEANPEPSTASDEVNVEDIPFS